MQVRPRKDHRGVDLISDVLPFGRLWYGEPSPQRILSLPGTTLDSKIDACIRVGGTDYRCDAHQEGNPSIWPVG